MAYQPLTREQFDRARQSGFSSDQIIAFEQKRKSELGVAPQKETPTSKMAGAFGGSFLGRGLEAVSRVPKQVGSALLEAPRREESVVAASLEEAVKDPRLATKVLASAAAPGAAGYAVTDIASRAPVKEALLGKTRPELGDIYRTRGVAEPVSKMMGLGLSAGLPTNVLAAEMLAGKIPKAVQKKEPGMLARAGAWLSGVEQETLEDVAKQGYRNVLKKEYYKKSLPSIIQQKIEGNIDDFVGKIDESFDVATQAVRNMPAPTKGSLREKLLSGIRKPKYITDSPEMALLDKRVAEINKGKFKSYGDLLDYRRELDDIIYGETKRKVGTDAIKKIRDNINDILHQSDELRNADEMFYNYKNTMREIGNKVKSDTGESFIGRFGNLTQKQKDRLIQLEKQFGGEPFVEDLTRYGLAKEFVPRARPSLYPASLLGKMTSPILRGSLRTGEKIGGALTKGQNVVRGLLPRQIPTAIRKMKER